jgi:wobble nucleotide-excising tRNase
MRGTEPAHNLSDGECSLVAFCYFLARLEDTNTQGTRPVVWVDDPISSLDSNHVFFLFSLIESQLTRPTPDATGANVFPYPQVFVSTHNLEFFKYLRRLIPTGNEKAHMRHFIVAKRDTGSSVECMPEYLIKYTTEFNFLFNELHTCVNPANQPTNLHSFFNFGANLRRFLEAYLYFKFPFANNSADQDFTQRIKLFFGDGLGTDTFVMRMAHEGAHLMGSMDRAMQPVERDEISKAAYAVLSAIRKADRAQYDALLSSIGKTCPL